MRRRTKARETALQFLYQADLRGESVWADLDAFLDNAVRDGVLTDSDAREFCRRLVLGTRKHLVEIDGLLKGVARNWDLHRMAAVDRNVLRMSTFEMLHCKDVPPKVSINEAIELAKRYSTANSGAFVNGILDRIRIDRLAASTGEVTSSAADAVAGSAPGEIAPLGETAGQ